jgi:hypothetical protein
MIRPLLIALVLGAALFGGGGFVLHRYFGWWGVAALPPAVLILGFIAMKLVGRMFKRVLLGLFSMKSAALRGAKLRVHSIAVVPGPTRPENPAGAPSGGGNESVTESEDEAGDPRDYVAVELTVTPAVESVERLWEPGELILTTERIENLEALEDDIKEVGRVESCRVWNGAAYDEDESCKYPGEQRLLLTFAVKPGTSKAWLQYYDAPVGLMDVPVPPRGHPDRFAGG